MSDEPTFHPAQCRAARALLGWTQGELAEKADVGAMTVKRFEAGKDLRSAQTNAMRQSLISGGIVFLDDGSICDGAAVSFGVALATGKAGSTG